MFITFEGIDGCGKTTQHNLFVSWLKNEGAPVVKIKEPGGTPGGEEIRKLLLHYTPPFNSRAQTLLFNAARAQLTYAVILPALEKGFFVAADRFYDSTLAYQGYADQQDFGLIEDICRYAAWGVEPDISFFLDVPVLEAMSRIAKRQKDNIESRGPEYLMKVQEGFLGLCDSYPERFYHIRGSQKVEEIHETIKHLFLQKAKKEGLWQTWMRDSQTVQQPI